MRSRELLTALRNYLADALADYPFPDPSGSEHDCRVFLHGLPDSQDTTAYPFVVVRWVDGELTEADASAGVVETVALVLGVYSPKNQQQAGLLLAELLDATMGSLRRCRILAEKFELRLPLRASIPEPEQRWDTYHMATITTRWHYVIPVTPLGAINHNPAPQANGQTALCP